MAGSRTLKLSILADVDDLKKKLNQGETEVSGFSDKLGDFGKKAAAAFAVAAAAAATYAAKLAVDGVKAAIEDEKAQLKLATTLKNVTGATDDQIASVEKQIDSLARANGIADDELRPSFERLVRATNDVTKAQDLQKLALDVAAGSGKSLQTVSDALAKAYDGNTGALSRLGVGLSANELKTMTFEEVTKSLSDTFKDQASAQAETFEGKMARLTVAFDEAKEGIGVRLLPILTSLFDYFSKNIGPAVESIKAKFAPLTKAIDDNKEEFKALWNFTKDNLVPFMTGALKLAIGGITTALGLAVTAVGKLVSFFTSLYNKYKAFVDFVKNNPLTKALGNIPNPFSNTSFTTTAADFSMAGNQESFVETGNVALGGNTSGPGTFFGIDKNINPAEYVRRITQLVEAGIIQRGVGYNTSGNIDPNPNAYQNYIASITVNGAIDAEGTARSIIDVLNNSQSRTGALGTLNI